MKVMTFNIQHGLDYKNQVIDLDLFARFIKSHDPDICALNEVRGSGNWEGYTDQTAVLSEKTGLCGYFGEAIKVAGTNPYGNAFLTKFPLKSVETVHIPDSDDRSEDVHYEHRCALKAVLSICGKDVLFIVCHMGLAKSEAANAAKTVCDILDSSPLPAVLMGDFNHTKESGTLDMLFERMSDADLSAEKSGIFTFPSYAPREKIDYILYRGMKCTYARVIEETVSDHFPVIAELTVE